MKKTFTVLLLVFFSVILLSCKKDKEIDLSNQYDNDIYYTLFVRSFADSNNDGIGDLKGVTNNLDYFVDLGITAIWLLPIFEANSYHGYDTVDYYKINEEYGSMEDFDELVLKAKEKNIKIMIDLVINHTSDQHEWFKQSSSSVDNEYRDYYVWKNGNAYQSFTGGLVDLNLENKIVVDEIKAIIDFYINKGVKGFRFDAVKHFFEEAGPNLEFSKNLVFMSMINSYIKKNDSSIFVVGEVLENDFLTVSNYMPTKNSYFNFYLKEEIINKVGHGGSSYLFSSNLNRMYEMFNSKNPDYIDSPMLGNHDLDRAASLITNESKLKQMVNVLLTLPGNPFIYYGDEIGMKGVRESESGTVINGVTYYDEFRRQPFLWGDSRDTKWLVSDGSNDDTDNYLSIKDDSIYYTYKNMINLRKNNPALMHGTEFYPYQDGTLQGYLRVINDKNYQEAVLVIHNLSAKKQEITNSLEVIFGNKNIDEYGTVIFKVPFNEIEEYK